MLPPIPSFPTRRQQLATGTPIPSPRPSSRPPASTSRSSGPRVRAAACSPAGCGRNKRLPCSRPPAASTSSSPFSCYTGCRLGEQLQLRCSDVRLAEAFEYIADSKNGDPRAVFLNPYAMASLAAHPRGVDRRDERVFRFHQGGGLNYLLLATKMIASRKA